MSFFSALYMSTKFQGILIILVNTVIVSSAHKFLSEYSFYDISNKEDEYYNNKGDLISQYMTSKDRLLLISKLNTTTSSNLSIKSTSNSSVLNQVCLNDNSTSICKHGFCNSTLNCECYDTHYSHTDSPELCSYQKKTVLVAFLLEFFIPIGAGHYYMNNYDFGTFKSFMFLVCGASFYLYYKAKVEKDSPETTKLIFTLNMLLFIPIYIAWQICDLALIGANLYTDGNGESLSSW